MMMSTYNVESSMISSKESLVKEGAFSAPIDPLPQLQHIRRIPERYREVLPLRVMQHHHCAVVGVARGVLTIAVASPCPTPLIDLLARFTGYSVFPVYVQSAKMDLLLRRVERWQRARKRGYFPLRQKPLVCTHIVGALLAYCDWQIKSQ